MAASWTSSRARDTAEPSRRAVQPFGASARLGGVPLDLERDGGDPIHLGGDRRADALRLPVELPAADDAVGDPGRDRYEEDGERDPEDHGPNANSPTVETDGATMFAASRGGAVR